MEVHWGAVKIQGSHQIKIGACVKECMCSEFRQVGAMVGAATHGQPRLSRQAGAVVGAAKHGQPSPASAGIAGGAKRRRGKKSVVAG